MDPLAFCPIPSSPLFPDLSLEDSSTASSSSYSTPRSSLYNSAEVSSSDNPYHHRSSSLASIDSGYFSTMVAETDGDRTRNLSKAPKHAPDVDSRRPLTPVNHQSADQEPLKRKGFFGHTLKKKKRSLGGVNPQILNTESFPIALQADHHISEKELPLPPNEAEIPFPEDEEEMDRHPSRDFEPRDYFIARQDMKHHPYSRKEAPYMQAYNNILLENDRYTGKLLRRLNPNQSPSFYDYGEHFPPSILDLGCGSGQWAIEAATFWPSSRVIGFDIIHPSRLQDNAKLPKVPSNVEWMQGNFLAYKLPFPSASFDLVRMANLSLCIPSQRWSSVLEEVRRVLTPGGSLELIDDHISFPYAKTAPQSPSTPHIVSRSRPSSSAFDDDDESDPNDEPPDKADDEVEPESARRISSLVEQPVSPTELIDPLAEWETNVSNSKAIEKEFGRMLHDKYNIDLDPLAKIEKAFDEVFGRYHSSRLKDMWLYLAPPTSQSPDRTSFASQESGGAVLKKAGKDLAKWMTTVEWDKKEREKGKRESTKGDRSSGESAVSVSKIPEILSEKAARHLGITPPDRHRSQSPGIILWPNTFISIPPDELEMHACKHIHTLLGCQAALYEFLLEDAKQREEMQPPNEEWWKNQCWDYECFRRKRLNWPADSPGFLEIPNIESTPRSPAFGPAQEHTRRARSSSTSSTTFSPSPLHPHNDLDFIRCIKVFRVTKVVMENPPIP